ncbi:Uncharacterised protein [Shigella sonnei]|nr:Uncharacterised protein [Shigella sonnei]
MAPQRAGPIGRPRVQCDNHCPPHYRPTCPPSLLTGAHCRPIFPIVSHTAAPACGLCLLVIHDDGPAPQAADSVHDGFPMPVALCRRAPFHQTRHPASQSPFDPTSHCLVRVTRESRVVKVRVQAGNRPTHRPAARRQKQKVIHISDIIQPSLTLKTAVHVP